MKTYKTPSKKKLKDNIHGREAVSDILKLAEVLIDEKDIFFEDRFWEILAETAARKVGLTISASSTSRGPMDADEADDFENVIVPYGIYQGKKVKDVPLSHWGAMVESGFGRQLQRYLRSERFDSKQRKEARK